MLPYVEWRQIFLGPVTIQVWGLLVALGMVAAAAASACLAKRRGLDQNIVWELLGWMAAGGIIGARLFHALFYEPAYYFGNPLEIFSLWLGGMAITGGIVGGALAGAIFLRRKHLDVWRYADVMAFGVPLGMFIGRLGCFFTHLHPGIPTNFFLGVRYPDGMIRHDLGLDLSLNGLLLFILFLVLAKRRVREGMFLVLYFLWDGVVRFGLDFLRVLEGDMADARYFGLTPAQYASFVMIAMGLWILRKKLPTSTFTHRSDNV